jgi:deazaflavin-dependent oxidoreductase (nitroreductase family)
MYLDRVHNQRCQPRLLAAGRAADPMRAAVRWRACAAPIWHNLNLEERFMSELNDWNAKVIAEFRANGGKVGGQFKDATMVLLTTRGARTGKERVNPLVYLPDGKRIIIFASKAGAPTNPDWFYNLRANPIVGVEVGTERYQARAVILDGEERDRLYAAQAKRFAAFADYQAKTTRKIPVIALERID